MARNDIKFAQGHQADFGQANQMFLQAQQQYNNAIKNAQDTVTAFDKAVTARTTAKAKEMVDALSLQDWQDIERREQLQQEINDYANSVGNMIDAKALQEYQQGNLKRLYDNENAGLEHQVNQNTLTRDAITTQQKQEQQDTINAIAKVKEFDTILANHTAGSDEHTATRQAKEDFLASLNPVVQMGVQDGLSDRKLVELERETKTNIAQDKLGDSQLLPHTAKLSALSTGLTESQALLSEYSKMPDGAEKDKLIAEETARLNLIQAEISATQKALPDPLKDKYASVVTNAIDNALTKRSKHYGTPFENSKFDESVRQYNASVAQRKAEAEAKAIADANKAQVEAEQRAIENQIEEVKLGIQLADAQSKITERNQKDKESSSSKLPKDSFLAKTYGNGVIDAQGNLDGSRIHNQLQQMVNNELSKNTFADDITDKEYQEFKTGDLQKLKQAHADTWTGFGIGFDRYVSQVDTYKFNGRHLTNGEKKAVLSELATGRIPIWGNEAQIKQHIDRLVLQAGARRDSNLRNTTLSTIQELTALGYNNAEIITSLGVTKNHNYFRYLPDDYKQAIEAGVGKPPPKVRMMMK